MRKVYLDVQVTLIVQADDDVEMCDVVSNLVVRKGDDDDEKINDKFDIVEAEFGGYRVTDSK